MRKLVALDSLNALDAFIMGAYMIAIPLLLVERNIDLTTIGMIFSAFPAVFLVSRMLFASAADSIGLKKFFRMNAIGNLVSTVLYAISSSPFSYTVAKGAQGIKQASLMAVNRNAAYEITNSEHPEMVTSTILFIRALAMAFGTIVSGFLIFWVGFHWLFALLAIISVLILVPARKLDIGKKKKLTLSELIEKLDPRTVDHEIWRTSIVMSIYVAASTLVVGFVLPIFLLSAGFGYWEIGMIFAAYVGVGALLLPVTLRKVPSVRITILIQVLLYFPAVLLIPLVGGNLMIVMVIMMALGESTSYIVWESLVSKAARKSENLATSIGFLHIPSNLVLIPAYLLAGLLVDNFGYLPPFWMAGFLFLVYSIAAWKNLKSDPER